MFTPIKTNLETITKSGNYNQLRSELNTNPAKLNLQDEDGKTVLHHLAEVYGDDYFDAINLRTFIDVCRNADLTLQDKDGNTALHIAISRYPEIISSYYSHNAKAEYISELAKHASNYSILNNEGLSVLHLAALIPMRYYKLDLPFNGAKDDFVCLRQQENVIRSLIAAHPDYDYNALSSKGKTAVEYALNMEHPEGWSVGSDAARLLLEAGAMISPETMAAYFTIGEAMKSIEGQSFIAMGGLHMGDRLHREKASKQVSGHEASLAAYQKLKPMLDFGNPSVARKYTYYAITSMATIFAQAKKSDSVAASLDKKLMSKIASRVDYPGSGFSKSEKKAFAEKAYEASRRIRNHQ